MKKRIVTLRNSKAMAKKPSDCFRLSKARPPFPRGCGASPPAPTGNAVGFLSFRLRRECGVKGFAGDPRSVTNGTPYRSLQPRIPFRCHLRECAVKLAASLDGSSVLAVQALFLSPFRGRTVSPCPR